MKKLLFTALAVVAFSGGAMAKTEEVKEVVVLAGSCDAVCHLAYDLARSEGASHDNADRYADMCYANCMQDQECPD